MREPPTRDFLKWDGELFHEQKSPAYYKRRKRSLAKLRGEQKQNPVPLGDTDCTDARYIPVSSCAVQSPQELSLRAIHINESPCPSERYISRVNHSVVPQWSTATVSELLWSDYWAGVYRAEIGATKLKLVPNVGDVARDEVVA
jgi:hypothetical protein